MLKRFTTSDLFDQRRTEKTWTSLAVERPSTYPEISLHDAYVKNL